MVKREITAQFVEHPVRAVVQALEPEAARLLAEKGGKVTRYELHGMYYWDYWPWEDHRVVRWPPQTLEVYVSARGQEDSVVIFAAFLLPTTAQELHMVYDYRSSSPHGPLEEYFTLRVAHEHEYVLQDLPDRPRDRAVSTGE